MPRRTSGRARNAHDDGPRRNCPICKEEIRAEATRCGHCRSPVYDEKPIHGGTCPYCRETIHPEALKCKHCGAFLGPTADQAEAPEMLAAENSAELLTAAIVALGEAFEDEAGPTTIATPASATSGCGPCDIYTLNGPIRGPYTVQRQRKCWRTVAVPGPWGTFRLERQEWYENCGPPRIVRGSS